MNWKEITLYVGLPVAILILYIGGMIAIPYPGEKLGYVIFSERGIIEIGTAVCFLLASITAFLLWYKADSQQVGKWKVTYLLIGFMALFVALEEINYGQFFFGFNAPETLAKYNSKGEFNLHNLFENKPSHRLNLTASIIFPAFFMVLPLIAIHKHKTYKPQRWEYYLLPERQLILFVIIGQLMSWFDDVFGFFGISNTWTRATETKELYWSLAVLLWLLILYRRIVLKSGTAVDFSESLSESGQYAMAESK